MANQTLRMLVACALPLAGMPALSATLTTADLSSNGLVITEYLANPVGVSDAEGEYFEIFNATSDTVDLGGLIVRDDGSNSFTVPSLTIAPLSFALFSGSDGSALGLTPDFVYGGAMSLTNGDDEIGLYRPDDTLISKVVYTDGDQFGAGIAHELAVLDSATPTVTAGPALGADFVAATLALPAGNFGSPGAPGNTRIDLAAVPLPAGVWMLLSALSMLGWTRRTRSARSRASARTTSSRDCRRSTDRRAVCR